MAVVSWAQQEWLAQEQHHSLARNSCMRLSLYPRRSRCSPKGSQICCCDQNWQIAFQNPADVYPTHQSVQNPCSTSHHCSCCPWCRRRLSCALSAGIGRMRRLSVVLGRGRVRFHSCAKACQCYYCCCFFVRASETGIEASSRRRAGRNQRK